MRQLWKLQEDVERYLWQEEMIFFGQPPGKNSRGRKGGENETKTKTWHGISILHHNVQSINNKLLELNVLLQSELADVDVLCLSEQ